MIPLKETAETVEGRLNFLQRFLGKKFGPEILFVFVCVVGVGASWYFNDTGYDSGYISGKDYSKSEIASLTKDVAKFEGVIEVQSKDILQLKKELDSCKNTTSTENLNKEVLKRIEEAENMKRLLEKKIFNDEKFNNNLNSILKNK